jgi:cytosine/adenosine deaminase-related metal-dependent hydrolase
VHGKTPARVMADGNALENALCVHFNYPSRGDIALLKKKGASVVFCPNSNKWFKRKVNHALPKLLKNGIAVGLGTDSLASNTDLDIRAEARQVMKLFPDMPLETVYKLMTTGGAKAMGVDNGLGELKPSSPFDAIHLNINVSGKKSPLHAIIDSRGPVLRSWVAGKEIFNNN